MKSSHPPFTRLFLVALLSAVSIGFVQAETVIKDQFGLKDRVAGLPLNKTSTESGDAMWQATPNVVMGAEGETSFVTLFDIMPFAARVPVPTTAKVISVEAKVRALPDKWATDKGNSNWIAVGIGNPQLGTPSWGNGVFLYIDPAGNYTCSGDSDPADFKSKSVIPLKRGKAPEFNPEDLNRIKLEYNRDDNTVSVWINGQAVFEKLGIEGKGFTVEPLFAGFSGFFQTPKTRTVSDFTVTYTP